MFGFLKTNHEARRDEVQAEFVARVAAAARSSSRPPARTASGWTTRRAASMRWMPRSRPPTSARWP